jgi:hypothetical protein
MGIMKSVKLVSQPERTGIHQLQRYLDRYTLLFGHEVKVSLNII